MPAVEVRHFNGDGEVCQRNDRVENDVQLHQVGRMALILILRTSCNARERSEERQAQQKPIGGCKSD